MVPHTHASTRVLAIQPSLKEVLLAFRKAIDTVAARDMHPDMRHSFKIRASGKHCLADLALFGFTPVLASWPVVQGGDWELATQALLKVRRDLPADWGSQLKEGRLCLTRLQLSLGGSPPWRKPSRARGVVSVRGGAVHGETFLIRCGVPLVQLRSPTLPSQHVRAPLGPRPAATCVGRSPGWGLPSVSCVEGL